MISFLKGKIANIGKNFVVLDVNGVGCRVYVADKVLDSLAKRASRVNLVRGKTPRASADAQAHQTSNGVNLHTKMIFDQHEGIFELFGFLEAADLDVFELLISVSGIGPKKALNILSSVEFDELVAAIVKDNPDYLRKISGLGVKTAQKLIIELRDKIKKAEFAKYSKLDLVSEGEAIDALTGLGYSQKQAQEALRKVPKKLTSLEDRVKGALKILNLIK